MRSSTPTHSRKLWSIPLVDSPAGRIGRNGQPLDDAVDVEVEFALACMATYWLIATSASSSRFYYENAYADAPTEPTTVPIGPISFADGFMSVRRLVDRDHENVVSWHGYATGGHYAAHQAPDVLIADLLGFYSDLPAERVDVRVGSGGGGCRQVGTGTTPRVAWGGVDVDAVVGMAGRVDPTLTCDLVVHVCWLTPSGCVPAWFETFQVFSFLDRLHEVGEAELGWEAAGVDRPVRDEALWW